MRTSCRLPVTSYSELPLNRLGKNTALAVAENSIRGGFERERLPVAPQKPNNIQQRLQPPDRIFPREGALSQPLQPCHPTPTTTRALDRKSTRLNSSHLVISYA